MNIQMNIPMIVIKCACVLSKLSVDQMLTYFREVLLNSYLIF